MKASIRIDSAPHAASYLPLANELEIQIFVEKYAEHIFGLKVIATTRKGKGGLFKIDVLAVDARNTPFIIECKWSRVRSGAIQVVAQRLGGLRKGPRGHRA